MIKLRMANFLDGYRRLRLRARKVAPEISLSKYSGERDGQHPSHGTTARSSLSKISGPAPPPEAEAADYV
jgi:hypothetical protein